MSEWRVVNDTVIVYGDVGGWSVSHNGPQERCILISPRGGMWRFDTVPAAMRVAESKHEEEQGDG